MKGQDCPGLSLSERLLIARGRSGLDAADVAKRCLKSGRAQTVRSWERGKVAPTWEHIAALCDIYETTGGVSRAWIMSGDGPIMTAAVEAPADEEWIARAKASGMLSPEEQARYQDDIRKSLSGPPATDAGGEG